MSTTTAVGHHAVGMRPTGVTLGGVCVSSTSNTSTAFAEASVAYDIDWAGFTLGRRSKEGFIFEHFTGTGTLVLGGGGSLLELNPRDYGGKIQVHGGAVVAFSDAVNFNVERIGALNAQTIMGAVFGGMGLNLVTLSGDGTVILQSTLHREFENDEKGDAGSSNPSREGLLGRL